MTASSRILKGLTVANVLVALAEAGSCVAGMLSPGIALPSGSPITDGIHFYVQAYGARALPLSAAIVLLAWRGKGLAPVLVVAGLAQAGDALIAASRHNPGTAAGAGAFAVLHLAFAYCVARRDNPPAPATAADLAQARA